MSFWTQEEAMREPLMLTCKDKVFVLRECTLGSWSHNLHEESSLQC